MKLNKKPSEAEICYAPSPFHSFIDIKSENSVKNFNRISIFSIDMIDMSHIICVALPLKRNKSRTIIFGCGSGVQVNTATVNLLQ